MEEWEIERDNMGLVYYGDEIMIDDVWQPEAIVSKISEVVEKMERVYYQIKIIENCDYDYEAICDELKAVYHGYDMQYKDLLKLCVYVMKNGIKK